MILKCNLGSGFVTRRAGEEEQVTTGGRQGEEEHGPFFCVDLSAVPLSYSSKCCSAS